MQKNPFTVWSVLAIAFCLLLIAPIGSLLFAGLLGDDQAIFQHLLDTVLFDYLKNSVQLLFATLLIALVLGVSAAWFIAVCQFPGKKYLQWMLMLPLAMPAYISAYIYTDMLDYAGPIQIWLRELFGWQSVKDYWFWDFRSISGAATVLALSLFPYIYLITRNSFARQEANILNAAHLLGASSWRSFSRIALPLARPAIAIGASLVAMETLADFAVAHYFAISTLTTSVYDTWLELGSLTAAAKISLFMLLGILALVFLERRSRQTNIQASVKPSEIVAIKLKGMSAYLVSGYLILIVMLGFALPALILSSYAIDYFAEAWSSNFLEYAYNSAQLGLFSGVICLVIALWQNHAARINAGFNWCKQGASLGYAIPGTVMAIGILIPLSTLDRVLNDWLVAIDVKPVGLIFTGTVVALIFAFVARFSAIAIGSIDAGYSRIPQTLDQSASLLGSSRWRILRKIHLPQLRLPMMTALLLVFIETIKELPAALLLRPFNYDTLATYVYQFVSDEQLELASMGALCIVLVGLIPLMILSKDNNDLKH